MVNDTFLIDTNVVMYAAGKSHIQKRPCAAIILSIADGSFHRELGVPFTDTEVFQEILYRFALTQQWDLGIHMCRHLSQLGLNLLPVGPEEVDKMIELAELYKDKAVPPRDLVHVAVMLCHGIKKIISADTHFDTIKEITRLDPQLLWPRLST